MRELRLVGPGEDGDSVIVELSTGGEQFSLPVDERLRAASRADRAHLGRLEVAGDLRPRDIQVRVRAGEDPQHLAEQAGVDLDRVLRFAYPVLQERGRVADEARLARARQGDGQLVDFGVLIDSRLIGHGIDPAATTWDAYRRPDGGWTVTATFLTADGRSVLTKFSFVLANRTVSALDDLAADLLADRPVALLSAPAATPEPDGAANRDAVLTRLTAVPDAEHATVEIPIANGTERANDHAHVPGHVRASRRERARTHPLPVAVDDELFDQDALLAPGELAGPLVGFADTPTVRTEQTPDLPGSGALSEEGSVRVSLPGPDSVRRNGKHGDKPRMPSWDDILLGVRRKTE